MRLPKRRHQILGLGHQDDAVVYLTSEGEQRLRSQLSNVKNVQRPKAVTDVSEALQKGDLSENAEYQEAKARLARIDGRIFSITDRLKRVVRISNHTDASEKIQIGSTVLVEVGGKQKTFRIVGPHESNPTRGRISYRSPLGAALLGHGIGELVEVQMPGGNVMTYRIAGCR